MPRRRPQTAASLLGLAFASAPLVAQAQEWVPPRTTPSASEIVSIDQTGEPVWLWGPEVPDLAGDGPAFGAAERGIDVRSVYATAGDRRFWVRVYFSATTAPPASTTAYVFVDTDQDTTTGGSAAATGIDAALTSDPSDGGYEWVIVLTAAASEPAVWQWDESASDYVEQPLQAGRATGDAGVDTDPLLVGDDRHGYLQGVVELGEIGVDPACNSRLFVRATSTDPALAPGDLDAGGAAPCVPVDSNSDDVPDVLVPPGGCTSDEDCPVGGTCVDGACQFPSGCRTDAECDPGEVCGPDGVCVAAPGSACTSDAACDGLVCQDGECVPCTSSGAACPDGFRCGGDGRCVPESGDGTGATAGLELEPGDRVRGGAFKCAYSGEGSRGYALLGALALALGGAVRRVRERRAGR